MKMRMESSKELEMLNMVNLVYLPLVVLSFFFGLWVCRMQKLYKPGMERTDTQYLIIA